MENKKIKFFDLNDNVDYHVFLLNGLFKNKDICDRIMSFIRNKRILKKNLLLLEKELDLEFNVFSIRNAVFGYNWYKLVSLFERKQTFKYFTYRELKNLLINDYILINDIEDFKEINQSKRNVVYLVEFYLKQLVTLRERILEKEKKIIQINDRIRSYYYTVEQAIKKQKERAKLYIFLSYDKQQIQKSRYILSALVKFYRMLTDMIRFNNFVGSSFFGFKLK